MRIAIALECRHTRLELHAHRAIPVGSREFDAPVLKASPYGGMRVTEAVAIAYLKYRDTRLYGIEERFGRRCPATVVRHEQYVRPQRRRCTQAQGLFDGRIDVAGQ